MGTALAIWAGTVLRKQTCKRCVEHGRLVPSAIEKTFLFSTSSFEIVWEFLVAPK